MEVGTLWRFTRHRGGVARCLPKNNLKKNYNCIFYPFLYKLWLYSFLMYFEIILWLLGCCSFVLYCHPCRPAFHNVICHLQGRWDNLKIFSFLCLWGKNNNNKLSSLLLTGCTYTAYIIAMSLEKYDSFFKFTVKVDLHWKSVLSLSEIHGRLFSSFPLLASKCLIQLC